MPLLLGKTERDLRWGCWLSSACEAKNIGHLLKISHFFICLFFLFFFLPFFIFYVLFFFWEESVCVFFLFFPICFYFFFFSKNQSSEQTPVVVVVVVVLTRCNRGVTVQTTAHLQLILGAMFLRT